MQVIVYGDFNCNCPYSYLASQRAELLGCSGIEVAWRSVEHDRKLPLTDSRADGDRDAWDRELAVVASLAIVGEHVPTSPPVLIGNTQTAVSACPEAVSDGAAATCAAACSRRSGLKGCT